MQQTQSPLLRLWQLGKDHHGGLIAAIFCAVAGVLLGLLPYLSAGHILVALLTGQRDWNFYFLWCMVALGGYLAKTLLYNLALSLSHKATFQILGTSGRWFCPKCLAYPWEIFWIPPAAGSNRSW